MISLILGIKGGMSSSGLWMIRMDTHGILFRKGRKNMKKVAVLIKEVEKQYEGLRTSLGLLLESTEVQMFVLNHEIANMDEAYSDNMGFLDEMEGERFSNHPVNIEKYGFKPVTMEEVGEKIKMVDTIIPF
jgi:hypothetical protein